MDRFRWAEARQRCQVCDKPWLDGEEHTESLGVRIELICLSCLALYSHMIGNDITTVVFHGEHEGRAA